WLPVCPIVRGGPTVTESLLPEELSTLIHKVFKPRATERSIAFLIDLPDAVVADSEPWAQRRRMVAQWVAGLHKLESFPLEVHCVLYRNAHSNNGDLPEKAWYVSPDLEVDALAPNAESLANHPAVSFEQIFRSHPLLVAPTEFSATAPLKIAARTFPFRAATMPGFSPSMIPALRLDYEEINRRVLLLKSLLDEAVSATCRFLVDQSTERLLRLDLRHRTAHASGGVFPDPGVAGNLPSGESYIVPYEGERKADPSQSEGLLPVELDGDIVTYRISHNRAVEVIDAEQSEQGRREAKRIAEEPAYANIAELGLGVLDAFGVEPSGEILLDEKLGLHIAFGRSDHFGGIVGPKQFSGPDAVVHIDRVYIPRIQPRVKVLEVQLIRENMPPLRIMKDGAYTIDFS
ncbi:MAG TPA: hypothetical protein PKW66_03825, partial [Polyangiaceae bacterium]|nr:hypothetical protein [Polyangiaceae bacterium]